MLNPAALRQPTQLLPRTLAWAGVGLLGVGFATHALWRELPTKPFAQGLALAALAAAAAWGLRRALRRPWAETLGWVWLAALVLMTGLTPALAVALLIAAALGVGTLVTGADRPGAGVVTGMALIAGVLGWLLPLPLHHGWSDTALLLALVVLRRRALAVSWSTVRARWREAVASAPVAAACAVMLLGLASAGAWLPTMQFDDLAYHLGLPWQLMEHARYLPDPADQVWALAPWAGDVLQAVPQLITRQEARGALNVAWLLAAAGGLYRVATLLDADAAARWTAVACYASLPLVAALLGGMQTETPAIAVTVWLLALALENPGRRALLAAALLYGLLWALKPMHGFAAAPLWLWALWRQRGVLDARLAGVLAALVFAIGGASYTYAWLRTGNPVLPLLNDVFRSPYFPPRAIGDARWATGFDPVLPWRISFDTGRYLESWNGGFGFALVVFAGAWPLALADRRTRAPAACASLAVALPLAVVQYARYTMPGLVALLPMLVVALHARLPLVQASAIAGLLCAANLAFQGNANWILHTGGIARSVGALGREAPLFARYAPERALVAALRDAEGPSRPVLLLDPETPAHAELAGRGRTTAWYSPRWQADARQADADASGAAWARLLRARGVGEVILRPAVLTPAQRAGLQRAGARRQAAVGAAEWWTLPEGGA
ncbi:MAG TPA: hypothetical protein VM576_00630 [Xanthomonadaceae bacterium]|nr:hypothetical protein [Xanthomonadaceae bacterium]